MVKSHYIPGTELTIYSEGNQFSFGIDPILLSSFARMKTGSTLIDIGAGTGILSLRCQALYGLAKVYGIEIQPAVAGLFQQAVEANRLTREIYVINKDLNHCQSDFINHSLDYIISNPPYVRKGSGIHNSTDNQLIARQEIFMTLEDLIGFASDKLKERGSLFLIHRPNRLVDILTLGRSHNLEPKRMRLVQATALGKPKMVMLELVRAGGLNFQIESPCIIYDDQHQYRKEILDIYEGK